MKKHLEKHSSTYMTKNYRKKTEKFFSEYFGKKRGVDVLHGSLAGRLEFEKFFSFLHVPTGSSVIELGCGYGRFVLQLLARGYTVTGVDISKESLDVLKESAEKNKLDDRLTLVENDFSKPIFKNKFEAAYCISTFHLLAGEEEDRIAIFSNLIKSVKPGGVVLVIEPNPLNPLYYPFYLFSDQVSWELEKTFLKSNEVNLRRIYKQLKLKNITVSYFGFLPNRFMNYIPVVSYLNNFMNNIPFLNKFSSFIYIRGEK